VFLRDGKVLLQLARPSRDDLRQGFAAITDANESRAPSDS
jgi:hypothetical protein